MHITRRHFSAMAGIASLIAVTRTAMAQQPIVIKFSHVVTNDTPKGKAALRFKELTEKYTNGRVRVEVYANSTLYKDKEEIEALQLGAVHMLAPATSKFAPLGVKEFEALDLPFAFRDGAHYRRAMTGELGQWLLKRLETKGITGLAFWDNGFQVMSANKPLLRPSDLMGTKMRISGSKIPDHYFRLLGAIPQTIAFSELYQSLQTGVVDGCENTASNYLTQKLHEDQKHISVIDHNHLHYAVIVNAKFWSALPADIRDNLDRAMQEATAYENEIAAVENTAALEAIQKSGKTQIHVADPASRAEWRTAMMPTWDWAQARVGKDVLELLKASAK